jgi:hypothetical protein
MKLIFKHRRLEKSEDLGLPDRQTTIHFELTAQIVPTREEMALLTKYGLLGQPIIHDRGQTTYFLSDLLKSTSWTYWRMPPLQEMERTITEKVENIKSFLLAAERFTDEKTIEV